MGLSPADNACTLPERDRPDVEELLDVIRQLIQFNRGGTFDAQPGEWAAYKRAKRLLDRHRPDAEQTS